MQTGFQRVLTGFCTCIWGSSKHHHATKLNQLKEVLGHRRMETTYKYVHLDRTNLRQEMEQGAL